MSATTKLSAPQDLVTEAYHQLRELILSGRLAPGAPIIEAQAAERLGLSRTPVRGALRRLQQEGFVVAQAGRRYSRAIVAPLTTEDVREICYIMGSLEGLAALLAARLPARERAALADELELVNSELLRAASRGSDDVQRAQDLHVRFHRIHVEAAAGPRLRAELDALHPQAERYERLYTTALLHDITASVDEHQEIADAIRAGDPDRAERAVAVNWRNGAARSEKVVAAMGERGLW